jgi:Uncharacterized protein conserved in bacteria (DUF2064)
VSAQRLVAVLATPSAAPPPGVSPEAYAAALLEDVCDLVATMAGVGVLLAACPAAHADVVADAAWPGTRVLGVDVARPEERAVAVLDAVATHSRRRSRSARRDADRPDGAGRDTAGDGDAVGGIEVVVLAGDAPDLPPLLVAKMFAAFDKADVAVCPCEGGGLVALGVRLPTPGWLRAADVSLDTPDAVARLAAAAPRRRALAIGPGWRRMRRPEDTRRLDPGLEGWEATRALLSGGGRPRDPR